jgi:hypothetical protein
MDRGGAFADFFGVGRDRIGGTADDRDIDLGVDDYDYFPFVDPAQEDTLARTVFGLSRKN